MLTQFYHNFNTLNVIEHIVIRLIIRRKHKSLWKNTNVNLNNYVNFMTMVGYKIFISSYKFSIWGYNFSKSGYKFSLWDIIFYLLTFFFLHERSKLKGGSISELVVHPCMLLKVGGFFSAPANVSLERCLFQLSTEASYEIMTRYFE